MVDAPGRPPAALSDLSGEGGGPQLTLGDLEPMVHHVGVAFGATCLAKNEVYLGVQNFARSDDRTFIEAVVGEVEVTSLRSAG
jgi:hypothetical protein